MKTTQEMVNFAKILAGCYDNIEQLNSGFSTQINNNGPNFIELKVNPGFRKNLGRPTISTIDSRDAIMKFIKDS